MGWFDSTHSHAITEERIRKGVVMSDFKVGDRIRPKPVPPPIAEVIEVYSDGKFLVVWPSGMRSLVTRPNEVEKVEED